MRWRAWLSVTPRQPEGYKGPPDERTRGQQLEASKRADERAFLEPPCDPGAFQHIADYLFEVGPTCGEHAVSWTEMRNWADTVGVDLDEFRAGAIIALSREFLAAMSRSRDIRCRLGDLLED